MRFTLGGRRWAFAFPFRLSPIRNASVRASCRRPSIAVAFFFHFTLSFFGSGSRVGRRTKTFSEALCFAVRVPLHRAKTRVSYERRVKSSASCPLLSVPTFRSRIIQAIHLNLPSFTPPIVLPFIFVSLSPEGYFH